MTEEQAYRREYGTSAYENDPSNPRRQGFAKGWAAAITAMKEHAPPRRRPSLAQSWANPPCVPLEAQK
jgi:hypothetical protein